MLELKKVVLFLFFYIFFSEKLKLKNLYVHAKLQKKDTIDYSNQKLYIPSNLSVD